MKEKVADIASPRLDIAQDKTKKNERKIVNIFLPISFSICFGCSKDVSLR